MITSYRVMGAAAAAVVVEAIMMMMMMAFHRALCLVLFLPFLILMENLAVKDSI